MKAYIGTKVVIAEPCTKKEYEYQQENSFDGREMEACEGDGEGLIEHGYMVGYSNPKDESIYFSWSPKDVFEKAYREISGDEAGIIIGSNQELK